MRSVHRLFSRFLLAGAVAFCLSGVVAHADDAGSIFSPDFPNVDHPESDHIPPAVPISKTLIIPVSAGDAAGRHYVFTATSSDPNVMVRVKTGNPLLVLTLDHAPANGDDSTIHHATDGELVFQLFRDLTPVAANNIAGFAQSGFYDGIIFHRLADFNADPENVPLDPPPSEHSFILQAGGYRSNADSLASGPTDLPATADSSHFNLYKDPAIAYDNEIVSALLYTGRGQLAMANAGTNQSNLRGTNGAQFFITNGPVTVNFGSNVDPWSVVTADGRHRESFQGRYTLFGQLTHGWNLLDKLQQTGLNGTFSQADLDAQDALNAANSSVPSASALGMAIDKPKNDIVITGAKVVQQYTSPLDGKIYTDASLVLSAKGSATATITVTASYLDAEGKMIVAESKSFKAYAVNDNFNDPSTLTAFEDQVVPPQTRRNLPFTAVDLEHDYISVGTKLYDLQNPSNTSPSGAFGLVSGNKIAFQGSPGFSGQSKGLLGAVSTTQYDGAYRGAIDGPPKGNDTLQPIGYDVGDRELAVERGILQGVAGELIPGCVVGRFVDMNPSPRSVNATIVASVAWGDGTPPDLTASVIKDTTGVGPNLNRYQIVATDKPTVVPGEIPDPRGLALKLSTHPDPLSEYVWGLLTPSNQVVLATTSSTVATVRSTLASVFNKVLQGSLVYTEARFAGVTLSAQTSALKALNPTGADLVRLNRLLLSDAYPGQFPPIASGPGHVYARPGIYTVTVTLTNGLGLRKLIYSTAVVRSGSLSAVGRDLDVPNGKVPVSQALATFTDTDTGTPNNFAVEIDWGDGLLSQGEVTRSVTGEYLVKGEKVKKGAKFAHAYADAETFSVTTHILKYDRDPALAGKILLSDAYAWSTISVANVKGAKQHLPPFDQVHLITALSAVPVATSDGSTAYKPTRTETGPEIVPHQSYFTFGVTVFNSGTKTLKAVLPNGKRASLSIVLSLAPDQPYGRAYVEKDIAEAANHPGWELPLSLVEPNVPFSPRAIPIPMDLKPGGSFRYVFDTVRVQTGKGKFKVLDYRLKAPTGKKVSGYNIIAYVSYSDPVADHQRISRFAAAGKLQGILIDGKLSDRAALMTDEAGKAATFEVSLDSWPEGATGTLTVPVTISSEAVAKVTSPEADVDGNHLLTFTETDFGGSDFVVGDFPDARAFAARLTAAKGANSTDLVSNYLIGLFSAEDQGLLADPALPLDQLKSLLAADLNSIISAELIYTNARFAGIARSLKTINLQQKQNRTAAENLQLNHYLLNDAYPVLLAKRNIRVVTITGVSDTPGTVGSSNPSNSSARSFTVTVGAAKSSVTAGKIDNPYYDRMEARTISGTTADISKNIKASVTTLTTTAPVYSEEPSNLPPTPVSFTVTLSAKPVTPVSVQVHAQTYDYQPPTPPGGVKPPVEHYTEGLLNIGATAAATPAGLDDVVTLVFNPTDPSLVQTVWVTPQHDGHTRLPNDPLETVTSQNYKITFDPATSTTTEDYPKGDTRFNSVKVPDITVKNNY